MVCGPRRIHTARWFDHHHLFTLADASIARHGRNQRQNEKTREPLANFWHAVTSESTWKLEVGVAGELSWTDRRPQTGPQIRSMDAHPSIDMNLAFE